MRASLLLLVLASIALACGGTPDVEEPSTDAALETLASWMTGSYSSAAQAEVDEDYHDIRLEMAPLWTDRTDGYWLYVEQAVASMVDKPYRRRVYHVHRKADGGLVSEVYALPEGDVVPVGAWRDTTKGFKGVAPGDLRLLEGCGVHLEKRADGSYAGGTLGDGCLNQFGGAAFARSEVEVLEDRIVSWDRGYDEKGEHVWGATKGGYVFLKAK